MDEEVIVQTFSIWTIIPYVVLGVMLFAIIFASIVWLRRKLTRPELLGLTPEKVRQRWALIRSTGQQSLMGAKLAILEADGLLDAVLKSMMMPGDTLGERLKVAGYKFKNLRDVWPAHKLRNQIAHEPSFQITEREARRALDDFERALKVLRVL